MRLIKVLERQTGYLIFIRSNHVSFYKVQCAIFAKQFSILILHYHALFPTFSRSGNAFTKFPTFSRLFPIVGTLSKTLPSNINLNGCSLSDKQHIINEFNVLYSKVGENLSKTFNDNTPCNFKQLLVNNVDSSIFMEPPRINEVFNLINSSGLH